MEDIVAIRVLDRSGRWRGYITWGRILDPVDTTWVEEIIRRQCVSDPQEIRVCESLSEVSKFKYFFEAIFSFANRGRPFGPEYKKWRSQREAEIEQGTAALYNLGEELGNV